jgi:hypothetical protein
MTVQFLPQVCILAMNGTGAREGDFGDLKMKEWTEYLHRFGALTDKNERGGINGSSFAHYGYPTIEEQDEAGLYPGSRFLTKYSGTNWCLNRFGHPGFAAGGSSGLPRSSYEMNVKITGDEIVIEFDRFTSIPDAVATTSSIGDHRIQLELVAISTTEAIFAVPKEQAGNDAAALKVKGKEMKISFSASEIHSYQVSSVHQCGGIFQPTSKRSNGLTVYSNKGGHDVFAHEQGWVLGKMGMSPKILYRCSYSGTTAFPPYQEEWICVDGSDPAPMIVHVDQSHFSPKFGRSQNPWQFLPGGVVRGCFQPDGRKRTIGQLGCGWTLAANDQVRLAREPMYNDNRNAPLTTAKEVDQERCPCESREKVGADCTFSGSIDEMEVHLRETHLWTIAIRTLHSWERRGGGSQRPQTRTLPRCK